ncbi:unnamed protein product [Penicillium olsonii]|uniref:WD repeat protein n=1 Tax=Penicillium olsonii TaxID=99116 RepID=A0A9W4HFT8_PENOL|nr:unnamed protein product [Penicillium olsonii]
MHTLKPVASSTLSLPTDNYIYKLTPAAPGTFAAISSDDSLRVFDANLNASVLSPAAHAGVTSLSRFGDSLLATGGRDGKVKVWDARAGKSVVEMQTGEFIVAKLSKSIPSWDAQIGYMHGSSVGESAGEKLKCDFGLIPSSETGPGSLGGVLPRDEYRRGGHGAGLIPGRCSLLLQYHPTRSNILLSGSTDGLANIYDTTISDEDEALVQVINHGSIHHAGFLSERAIFALSHDELFSVHPATDPDDAAQEPEPVQFGDLREPLGCEYIAQLCLGAQPYIAAGNKEENRLDLVPLVSGPWSLDRENLWRLPGAHGEEVVRSVHLDEQSSSVFTCGEDGYVRVWKPEGGPGETAQSESKSKARPKEKKKDRFRPY